MQEAAGRHAEKLGVGVRELHGKGLTWVLARLHVKVNQVPGAGQSMHIATWPSGRHRLFAVRDFRLSDNTGMEILRATSAWALMNMETRRLARLDPHLPVFSRCPERMIADDFLALPLPQRADHTTAFRAVAADIDINNHVNNLVYMDWALRAVAAETSRQKLLSLEAAFLREARLDDEIICRSESTVRDGITIVRQSLQDALSSRELTRLCWTFEKPVT
jgi:medium-chain acyl-[acyl-carrier-protein] hydrolase